MLVTLLSASVAHAEPAFSPHARDNQAEDVRRALARMRPAKAGPLNGSGHAMGFLVASAGEKQKRILGVDLDDKRVAWNEAADVRSRIAVGPGLIVHRQGEGELVGRDPRSGAVKLTVKLPKDAKFIGAAVDEDRVFYVLQATGGSRRTSDLVAIDFGGSEKWRDTAVGSLGAPAARGGVVAVPFAYQNLVLVDGKSGSELARVRAMDEQISFARATPEGIFFGGPKGVTLLDERAVTGTRKESSVLEANLGGAERAAYGFDGYQGVQVDYGATDRNRLLWRGEPRSGRVAFQDGTVFLHTYRYVFAFDPFNGKLRWAFANPRQDVIASDAARTAVPIATADGDVGLLDAGTGSYEVRVKTGLRLLGGTFDAEGAKAAASADSAADLARRLEQIIWDPDARFNTVKAFAARALADIPGKEASLALLKIVQAPTGISDPVQKAAGDRLVERKDKEAATDYLEALKRSHYDHLDAAHKRGVDVLARALAAIDSKAATGEIVAHLKDHETPQAALKDIVASLSSLGGKEAATGLQMFLLTYRSDPAFLEDPTPLVLAGEGLAKQGGPEGRRAVVFASAEPRTLPPVAAALRKVLEASR
jgi:outer membrane protein assembly factor BamB